MCKKLINWFKNLFKNKDEYDNDDDLDRYLFYDDMENE